MVLVHVCFDIGATALLFANNVLESIFKYAGFYFLCVTASAFPGLHWRVGLSIFGLAGVGQDIVKIYQLRSFV